MSPYDDPCVFCGKPARTPAEILPAAEPGASGPAALGRKGRRALLIVLVCVVWGFAATFPGIEQDWRSPWVTGLIVSTPVPAVTVLLIAFAPKIHRFGRWLDATFGPDAPGDL